MTRPLRVAFLNTHPIQYFAPLYAYLNRWPDLAITGLYLSDYSVRGAYDRAFGREVKWDVDLLAGYDACFVADAGKREEPRGFWSMLAPELWFSLGQRRFDALVVHGHVPAAYVLGLLRARLLGIPVFMRCDTHLGLSRSALKRKLRRLVLGSLYRCCAGVLAVGSANAAFYRAMGVPERKIFLVPFAVDNERFIRQGRLDADERLSLRRSLGVEDERPVVLFAAKFQQKKRPADLIRAAARLNAEGIVFQLAMVGAGELEADLRSLATDLRVDNVCFPGFVNQAALPRLYAACDVFVLPSDNEPWGLAVNEAMCAGMPIVASNAVGCVVDLVKDGVNGQTFQAGDIDGLVAALRPILSDRALRERYGSVSREIISRWSFAECRDGLQQALSSIAVAAAGT